MLILKLYPGQTIWVGKDIQITVLGNLQEFVRMARTNTSIAKHQSRRKRTLG
jgi:sRNA-binding carbon storage regulator CsrA